MKALVLSQFVVAAIVISRTVDSVGEAVIFLGAVAVAFEALRRVVGKPAYRLYLKADRAFDLILAVPSRLDKVERRLEAIEGQTSSDLTVEHHFRSD